MGRIVVLGEESRVCAFALAGAVVTIAEEPEAVRAAWDSLPDDVSLVVLTPAAARALPAEPALPPGRLAVTLPG